MTAASPHARARATVFAWRIIECGHRLMMLWFASVAVFTLSAMNQVVAAEAAPPANQASKTMWRARGTMPQPLVPDRATVGARALQAEIAGAVPLGEKTARSPNLQWSQPKQQRTVVQVADQVPDTLPDPFGERPQLPPTSQNEFDRVLQDGLPSRQPSSSSRQSLDPFPQDTRPTPRRNDDRYQMPPTIMEDAEQAGCDKTKERCEELIATLRRNDIKTIYFGIQVDNGEGGPPIEGKDIPCECTIPKEQFVARAWSPTTMTWKATGTCHKPLYFEDVQLERYGHSWNPVVQPFMSAAHFFVSVPLLPYNMGVTPPHECIYTLGYYRPGNCAPFMLEAFPLSARGLLFEAIGVTGFAFWFWPPGPG